MARGVQPSAQQLAEERQMTLQSATAELVTWDAYEAKLLAYLDSTIGPDATLGAILDRLQRGNRIEDADHLELHAAVREVAS